MPFISFPSFLFPRRLLLLPTPSLSLSCSRAPAVFPSDLCHPFLSLCVCETDVCHLFPLMRQEMRMVGVRERIWKAVCMTGSRGCSLHTLRSLVALMTRLEAGGIRARDELHRSSAGVPRFWHQGHHRHRQVLSPAALASLLLLCSRGPHAPLVSRFIIDGRQQCTHTSA